MWEKWENNCKCSERCKPFVKTKREREIESQSVESPTSTNSPQCGICTYLTRMFYICVSSSWALWCSPCDRGFLQVYGSIRMPLCHFYTTWAVADLPHYQGPSCLALSCLARSALSGCMRSGCAYRQMGSGHKLKQLQALIRNNPEQMHLMDIRLVHSLQVLLALLFAC